MEILATTKDRVTVVLEDDEIGYLSEACFALGKHPMTAEDRAYDKAVGRLLGEFGMLFQLRELAKDHRVHGDIGEQNRAHMAAIHGRIKAGTK